MINKILLIGSENVGKTTITKKYCNNEKHTRHIGTIGVDFGAKNINILGTDMKMHIWDTSGNERFNFMIVKMIEKVDMPIFVCDLMDCNSINIIYDYWLGNLNFDKNKIVFLLCNKFDIYKELASKEHKEKIDKILEKISKKVKELECLFKVEYISGITNENIDCAMTKINEIIYCHKLKFINNNLDENDSDGDVIKKHRRGWWCLS